MIIIFYMNILSSNRLYLLSNINISNFLLLQYYNTLPTLCIVRSQKSLYNIYQYRTSVKLLYCEIKTKRISILINYSLFLMVKIRLA